MPQIDPSLESTAKSVAGRMAGVGVTTAEERHAATVAVHDSTSVRSGQPKKTTNGGAHPQTESSDAAMPSAIAPAPSGYVSGSVTSAPANGPMPSPLIPAIPAGESSFGASLAVPSGARLPALFLDERPLPLPQRRVLDRVANEFIDAVAGDTSGQNRDLWETAREAADQQYIKLYGHAAYNALHLQSAREAVREQRATIPPTTP